MAQAWADTQIDLFGDLDLQYPSSKRRKLETPTQEHHNTSNQVWPHSNASQHLSTPITSAWPSACWYSTPPKAHYQPRALQAAEYGNIHVHNTLSPCLERQAHNAYWYAQPDYSTPTQLCSVSALGPQREQFHQNTIVCQSSTTKSHGREVIVQQTIVISDEVAYHAPDTKQSVLADSVICYGMLIDIDIENPTSSDRDSGNPSISVYWDGTSQLQSFEKCQRFGTLSNRILQIMTTLAENASVDFQIMLPQSPPHDAKTIPSPRSNSLNSPKISLILYGPQDTATIVGEWLHKCNLYLQAPKHCDRNVPYRNPHCLSFDDREVLMTFEIDKLLVKENTEDVYQSSDLFTELDIEIELEEAEQPDLITTPLQRHQKHALSFMLQRENGWDFESLRPDIWKTYSDNRGRPRYRNTLSGHSQLDPPPVFHGGCLADAMGLGKTLSMLSLIAANPRKRSTGDCRWGTTNTPSETATRATLIVVPFSLLQVWETQIKRHVRPSALSTLVYHGSNRHKLLKQIGDCDIVVTSYNCVSLDFKATRCTPIDSSSHTLFFYSWHRVILDEAHMIRSNNTANTRAIYALNAEKRWAVTGTPIQNRLGDLASLLRFLRVHPYDDSKVFEKEISQPWKVQMDAHAIQRLQRLVQMISLRRSKSVISLSPKQELLIHINLSLTELEIYEATKLGIIKVIEDALTMEHFSGSAYLNAFQRINDLRYICNHGAAPVRKRKPGKGSVEEYGPKTVLSFQEQLDKFLGGSTSLCLKCGTDLDGIADMSSQMLRIGTECDEKSQQICRGCLNDAIEATTVSDASSPSSDGSDQPSESALAPRMSSKVSALIQHIQNIPASEKCVVFSYWTSTLDVIQGALTYSNLTFCRYDGRLSRTKRTAVLATFTNDANVQAILVSITCGGQGLDLTAANHAFLVEPQWNPMLEEQAMSRIHRIGQTKPVKMVRFVMRGTWEENIVSVQEKKRTLADLIMDRRRLKSGDDGKRTLMYLKELVG